MKKHVRRSSLSAGGISQYIGIIVSITLLAHGTVLFGSEPQKGRLARAWEATRKYTSKARKRVGLDNPKERARNTIQNYASRAQASLQKFIVCLEGKAGCSREDIRKVRLYTAIVITAITILGIGYKVSQKPKDGRIEPEAPKRRPIDEEEGEEEEPNPIKNIVEASKQGMWQPFFIAFERIYPEQKIDWESEDGKTIAENVHKFWNKLPSETKYNLQKRGFLMTHDERSDWESMRSEEENLRIINRSIDSLLDITGGRSNVDIQKAMIGLNRDNYQALKDFLDGPLSEWIHRNWHTFNEPTKQALAKFAFILNENERADLAKIEEFQRRQDEEKREQQEAERLRRTTAKERAEAERAARQAAVEEERARREEEEREGASPPPPDPTPEEEPKGAEGRPGDAERMEVEEPEPAPEEGWGTWIARGVSNWWKPPPNK